MKFIDLITCCVKREHTSQTAQIHKWVYKTFWLSIADSKHEEDTGQNVRIDRLIRVFADYDKFSQPTVFHVFGM